ncbi:MAG TPA: hypothetical protein VGS79_24755 [Puia sp.]|nr:hypothetical protein [Puia sp.]
MPYPFPRPGKRLFSGIILALLATGAKGAIPPENFGDCARFAPHISPDCALYKRDTSLEQRQSGIVRHQQNGNVVIAVPSGVKGHYKVRFFDETNALLFEIREIGDSPLIVEKYNFVHAGVFQYELYRDNRLIERRRFRINP